MLQDPFIGYQLANFRIDRLLGRGGMASVYLGWDLHLQRPVAIKVIAEQYRENPAYVERFLREARAIAAWQHRNIAQVHSAGREDNLPYFVMEYLHGKDLGQVLREYAAQGLLLPYQEVVRIGRAVANALDYAHERGVIHRDVKPSNVMIGDDGRVVLTDFGLAMNMAEGTMGEVFGSPQYIAPEQARSSASVVPQSDLYALGVMLYEMLVGRLPFLDPFPAALAMQHINAEPPQPTALNPMLPARMDAVLLKALRKNPAERFQSGRELMDAVEAVLGAQAETAFAATDPSRTRGVAETAARPTEAFPPGNGVAGQPPAVPPPPAGLNRRRSYGWAGGCLLLALLAFGVVYAVYAFGGDLISPPAGANPTATATSTQPAPTHTNAPTETAGPIVATAFPSPTPTDTPTATATATETAVPTATATESPTVTPTEAPSPTSTPEPYRLDIVKYEDLGLFVINRSAMEEPQFPLRLLHFTSRGSTFDGDKWDVDGLAVDECVALWRDRTFRDAPNELECDLVGETLRLVAPDDYWDRPFDVWFDEEEIGTCNPNRRPCEVEILRD